MILHYLKVAARNLLKFKGQTLISIIGLSVGLFCFSICTHLVRGWMAQNEGFPNYERIAEICLTTESRGGNGYVAGTPPFIADDMEKQHFTGVERITALSYASMREYSFEISDEKKLPYSVYRTETDSNFVDVLGLTVISGNIDDIKQQPNSAVLSESFARRIYGNSNPIGKTVDTGEQLLMIRGLIRDFPANNSLGQVSSDLFCVSVEDGDIMNRERYQTGFYTLVLLSKGYTVKQLDEQLLARSYEHILFDKNPHPTRAIKMGNIRYENKSQIYLYGMILLIGLLILLATMLNYFSFQTGSFLNRMKEFSIRKEAGSEKQQLFALLSIESVICLLLAGILALCYTEIIIPHVNLSFFGIKFEFDIAVMNFQIVEYLLILLLLSLLICVVLTVRIFRKNQQEGFTYSKHRLRNILLTVQFAICLLFLGGAMAAVAQFRVGERTLLDTLTKQEKERILTMKTDYSYLDQSREVMLSKVRTLSEVEDVLLINGVLMNSWTSVARIGEGDYFDYQFVRISSNVCEFLRIPLILQQPEWGDDGVFIAQAHLASLDSTQILGQQVTFMGRGQTLGRIAGVFSGITNEWMGRPENRPFMFRPLDSPQYNIYAKVYPGKEKQAKAALTAILKEFLPESIPPTISTLKAECDKHQQMETMIRDIFFFFAIVCLIITLMGVYSTISQDTESRRKEVAIRKVNGARLRNIYLLFARLYFFEIIIAAVIAFPVVWFGATQLFGIMRDQYDFNNPWFWLLILGLVFIVTIPTIFFRIQRIATSDPAQVLKTD